MGIGLGEECSQAERREYTTVLKKQGVWWVQSRPAAGESSGRGRSRSRWGTWLIFIIRVFFCVLWEISGRCPSSEPAPQSHLLCEPHAAAKLDFHQEFLWLGAFVLTVFLPWVSLLLFPRACTWTNLSTHHSDFRQTHPSTCVGRKARLTKAPH